MAPSPRSTRSSRHARSTGRSPTSARGLRQATSSPFSSAAVAGAGSSFPSPTTRPRAVEPVGVEQVLGSVPRTLVDLALWIAAYYGSTPARALALVAPPSRARRGKRRRPARRGLSCRGDSRRADGAQQDAALARIVESIGGGGRFLLYGETGSGKTEVYLRACAAALERGLGAIVLVPEIALTPQAFARFRNRFGDRVACLHSGSTEAQRRDERERIASGEAPVVVGARSAIFAPLPRLGLVCVDEEQDSSYKQDADPRYDARSVARTPRRARGRRVRVRQRDPRPESWQRLDRLELGGRLHRPLPTVRIVDLRREGGYPLSAPRCWPSWAAWPPGAGRPMLLLNRRGIAPALHCRACGGTQRCPACDVPLVLHADRRLHCHHCGHARPSPSLCPVCGSAELARIGAGTERLERGAGGATSRARALSARRGHGRGGRPPRAHPRELRRRRSRGAAGDADGGEGASLLGRPPCGGHRRRRRAAPSRLPCRGAGVPARHAARRAGAGATGRAA